jgi:hypothetical protein
VAFEGHKYHHKTLSLSYEPIHEGVLVMSNIHMGEEVSHAPLYCTFGCCLAILAFEETSFLQPHLPTQLVHLTFFVPSWRVHLDLQTL